MSFSSKSLENDDNNDHQSIDENTDEPLDPRIQVNVDANFLQ